MPLLGGIIPGASGPERVDLNRLRDRRERRRVDQADAFQRALDEAELSSVPAVEADETVHTIKHNDTEEGHEDRAQHGFYDLQTPQAPKPRIDIAG